MLLFKVITYLYGSHNLLWITGFESQLIPGFSDGDRCQMYPCFAAFKRIKQIWKHGAKVTMTWLQIWSWLAKPQFELTCCDIFEYQFRKMSEFYRDKESNFMIETLIFTYYNQNNISDEDIEFINKISPKILEIEMEIYELLKI